MSGTAAVQNAVKHGTSSDAPRTIRARTGQTEDPLPPGKKVAEPTSHFDIAPEDHNPEQTAMTPEEKHAHIEELQAMQNMAPKVTASAPPNTRGEPSGAKMFPARHGTRHGHQNHRDN